MQIPRFFRSPVFIILVVAILSFWPVSFFIYTFKWDMLDVVLPFRYFAGECIQNGVFPLWNPYQLTGSPIYADMQYPLWSPEVWLVGLTTGYNIYILHILFIFYIFLAGYGMYRLTFHFSGHSLTSLAVGISYMLSGFFVGHGQALFSIIGAAFLPWVVLYMIKNLANPTLYGTIKLALVIFLQISTGYQAISIITGYLLFLLFLYSLFLNRTDRNRLYSLIKFNGLLFAFVIILCLVIIIPVFEISSLSDRLSMGLSYKKAIIFPFTLKCLVSLFTPFATVKYPEFFKTDLSMSNMHFGLIMLIVFVVTFFKRKTGLQWVMLIFGVICFLASLGDALPVHPFFYKYLPLFNRLRMPAYFTLFAIFAILFSTGIHLPEVLKKISSFRKSLVILVAASLGILLLFFTFSIFHINFHESILRKAVHQPYLIWDGLTFYENVAIQSVIQGLLLTLILITLTNKKLLRFFGTILPVIMILEMILAVNLNLYYTVISTTRPGELYEYMANQPKGFPLPDNTSISDNSDKKLMNAPLYRNMGILTKRISYDGFTSFILKPYNFLYDSLPVLKDTLLHNPLVYLSGSVRKIGDLIDRRVVLSRKDLFISDSIFSVLPPYLKKDASKSKVNILSFSANSLKVQYNTDSSAIITVMQADYPGWRVKIDGKEVPHFKSGYLYLSALAPPGNHQVLFEYENKVASLSFIISYSVLFLLIALVVYLHFRSSSAMKARLFTTLIIVAVTFGVFKFFSDKYSVQKKIKDYKILSSSLLHWSNTYSLDTVCSVFNLDDTLLFNQIIERKKEIGIKYFRFNDAGDLGNFYRFVLTSRSNDLVYGYSNLYNPAETGYMIRERFPIVKSRTDKALGNIALYSRSGEGEPLKITYTRKNDYESDCKGWTGDTARYETSVTSTGIYSEKMDSTCLYSTTFHESINNISKGNEIAIVITADVYLVGNSSPLLVCDEKKGDRSIRWNSLDVKKFVSNSGRWEKVFFMVKPGKNRSVDHSIVIYFWNPDKSTFYIDNFKVEGVRSDK